MITTNRAQMQAAIKAVEYGRVTVIIAVNETGRTICKYTFDTGKSSLLRTVEGFEKHLHKISRNVARTPAHIWR